ncbi:MAG: hypothetical protein EXQ95_13080 [Alphaproteobacteria bacterium]|nr:hypothetical protein [Alphaproteobacteria bacterium]
MARFEDSARSPGLLELHYDLAALGYVVDHDHVADAGDRQAEQLEVSSVSAPALDMDRFAGRDRATPALQRGADARRLDLAGARQLGDRVSECPAAEVGR